MNYMSEVAKMLGVELDEEFEIKMPNETCHAIAKFTNGGLKIINHNVHPVWCFKDDALENLLTGCYAIKRKPWKPILDEDYYYIDEDGYAMCDPWADSSLDIILYKIGNCYKTKDAAIKDKDKWLTFYTSEKMLEV